MSSYVEDLWGGVSSIFGGDEEVERAARQPTEVMPEPTIPGQLTAADLADPAGGLVITPEDMGFAPGFAEDFKAYESAGLGEQGGSR